MGKAIYRPKRAAEEYNTYAVNFYNGCEGNCDYCYLKKFPFSQFWSTTPTLKKALVSGQEAYEIFKKELQKNLPGLQEEGLFFNFSSDPLLRSTWELNSACMSECFKNEVQSIILTKQTWWFDKMFKEQPISIPLKKSLFFGFTLTGMDEMEPGCATNKERIETMKKMHDIGVMTWASIEPIVNIELSHMMISETLGKCDHYKIGLKSGMKYKKDSLLVFMKSVNGLVYYANRWRKKKKEKLITVYYKESFQKQAEVDIANLPYFCVGKNFKPWKDEISF